MKPLFPNLKFNFQNVLASFIVINCFCMLLIVMFIADKNNPHVAEVRTIASSVLMLVIGYYFGSSKGSKTKDETISNVLNNQNEPNIQNN